VNHSSSPLSTIAAAATILPEPTKQAAYPVLEAICAAQVSMPSAVSDSVSQAARLAGASWKGAVTAKP
jgi:hypothetical protein